MTKKKDWLVHMIHCVGSKTHSFHRSGKLSAYEDSGLGRGRREPRSATRAFPLRAMITGMLAITSWPPGSGPASGMPVCGESRVGTGQPQVDSGTGAAMSGVVLVSAEPPVTALNGSKLPKRKCCTMGNLASTSSLYIFSRPLLTWEKGRREKGRRGLGKGEVNNVKNVECR